MKVALPLLAALLMVSPSGFAADGGLNAGVGQVDITPGEPVILAGSPSPKRASEVKTRLYLRALVLSASGAKLAIFTLDTLKYPAEHVKRAQAKIHETTGIPAGNFFICASHTHSGPLWSYYTDQLVTPIVDAVTMALRDLAPCRVGTTKGGASAGG